MADGQGEISSIGVKLTLDTSDYKKNLEAAKADTTGFSAQVEKAASGAAQMRADNGQRYGKGQGARNLDIGVTLHVSDTQLHSLRARVQNTLRNIPISFSPAGGTASGRGGSSIEGAAIALASQTGMTQQQSRNAASRTGSRVFNVPPQGSPWPGRAMGGPVAANRGYIVGELRPEVFVPKTPGIIEPSVADFYRKQEMARREQMRMATIDYAAEQQFQRAMRGVRGASTGLRGLGLSKPEMAKVSQFNDYYTESHRWGDPGGPKWWDEMGTRPGYPNTPRGVNFKEPRHLQIIDELKRLSGGMPRPSGVRPGYSANPSSHIMRSLYSLYKFPDPMTPFLASDQAFGEMGQLLEVLKPMKGSDFGVFHATSDLKGLLSGGFKTANQLRDETGQAPAGLGGTDDIVSTAFSLSRTRHLADTMRFGSGVARGEHDLEKVLEYFRPRYSDKQWANGPLSGDTAKMARERLQRAMTEEWHGQNVSGLGDVAARRASKTFDLFKSIDFGSDSPGDPIRSGAVFMGARPETFAKLDPKNIGVVQAAIAGVPREDAELTMTNWETTPPSFHGRTRSPRHDWAYGGIKPWEWEMRTPPRMLQVLGKRMAGGPVGAASGKKAFFGRPKGRPKFYGPDGRIMSAESYYNLPLDQRKQSYLEKRAYERQMRSYERMDPREIDEARAWYPLVNLTHQAISQTSGIPMELTVGAAATASPRVVFPGEHLLSARMAPDIASLVKQNPYPSQAMLKAISEAKRQGSGVLAGNALRAAEVQAGQRILKGRKITDYRGSILDADVLGQHQGAPPWYTNDIWQNRLLQDKWVPSELDAEWWAARAGGKRAAQEIQQATGLATFDLQAASWTQIRSELGNRNLKSEMATGKMFVDAANTLGRGDVLKHWNLDPNTGLPMRRAASGLALNLRGMAAWPRSLISEKALELADKYPGVVGGPDQQRPGGRRPTLSHLSMDWTDTFTPFAEYFDRDDFASGYEPRGKGATGMIRFSGRFFGKPGYDEKIKRQVDRGRYGGRQRVPLFGKGASDLAGTELWQGAAGLANPNTEAGMSVLGSVVLPTAPGIVTHEFGHAVQEYLRGDSDPYVKRLLKRFDRDAKYAQSSGITSPYAARGATRGWTHESFAEMFTALEQPELPQTISMRQSMASPKMLERWGRMSDTARELMSIVSGEIVPGRVTPKPQVPGQLQMFSRGGFVEKLLGLEQQAFQMPIEKVSFLSRQGKTLFQKTGTRDSVDLHELFPPYNAVDVGGSIATHNHPAGWFQPPSDPRRAGNSLSPMDMMVARDLNLSEMRATTPTWVHSVRPPKGVPTFGEFPEGQLRAALNLHDALTFSRNWQQINKGNMPKALAEAQHRHQVMTGVADEFGFRYSRKPFGRRAGGGPGSLRGMYLVGEIGEELFVPSDMAHMIPKKVMDQIPKAAGGMQVIGRRRNHDLGGELFVPPSDGVIVPNRLMDQVPRAADGVVGMGGGSPLITALRNLATVFVQAQRSMPASSAVTPISADVAARTPRLPGSMEFGYAGHREGSSVRAPSGRFTRDISDDRLVYAGDGPGLSAAGRNQLGLRNSSIFGEGYSDIPDANDVPDFLRNLGKQRAEWQAMASMEKEVASANAPAQATSPMAGNAQAPQPQMAPQGGPQAAQRPAPQRPPPQRPAPQQAPMPQQAAPQQAAPQQAGPTSTAGAQASTKASPEGEAFANQLMDTFRQRETDLYAAGTATSTRTPQGLVAMIAASLPFFGGSNADQQARVREQRDAMRGLEKATTGVFKADTSGTALEGQSGKDVLRDYLALQDELTLARDDEKGAIQDTIDVMTDAVPELGAMADAQDKNAAAIQRSLPGLKEQAGGLLKVVAGITVYGKAMQAISMGVAAATPAAGAFIDQARGFRSISDTTTTALAQQTKAAQGNVTAVMNQYLATNRLSGGLADLVEQKMTIPTAVKAGAMAAKDTENAIKATIGVQDGVAPGTYGGYGGVFEGPFLAELMGGGVGGMEALAGTINNLAIGGEAPEQSLWDAGADLLQQVGHDIDRTLAGGQFGIAEPDYGTTSAPAIGSEEWTNNIEILGELGESMTDAAGRAEKRFASFGTSSVKWVRDAEAAAMALKNEDLPQYIKDFAEVGVVAMVDGKAAITKELADTASEQTIAGFGLLDPGTWAKEAGRVMQAQFRGADEQGRFQMETMIPYNLGTSLIQQPLIDPTAGVSMLGVSAQERRQAQRGLGGVGRSQERLGLITQNEDTGRYEMGGIGGRGIAAMQNLIATEYEAEGGQDSQAFKSFDAATQGAMKMSSAISDLTADMLNAQQAAADVSYANQIRLANRALGDALGMLGEANGTRLGYLQREQYLAGRASQSLGLTSQKIGLMANKLSLALQARQIATNLAVAQFQAPGETGEERYARQREAIIRAGIEKKQLGFSQQQQGISEQQFGISQKQFVLAGQIWAENAQRAATDASKTIAVMQASRSAQLQAAVAQKKIAVAQQRMGEYLQRAANVARRAENRKNQYITSVTQGATSLGAAFEEVAVALRGAIDTLAGGGTQDRGTKHAAGFLGTVSGATRMTVGEAGAETVAILRNPRTSSLNSGGGGGPMSLSITISGNTVRSDDDLERLATMVARKVEKSMGRKGQMLGLRAPSY